MFSVNTNYRFALVCIASPLVKLKDFLIRFLVTLKSVLEYLIKLPCSEIPSLPLWVGLFLPLWIMEWFPSSLVFQKLWSIDEANWCFTPNFFKFLTFVSYCNFDFLTFFPFINIFRVFIHYEFICRYHLGLHLMYISGMICRFISNCKWVLDFWFLWYTDSSYSPYYHV